MTIPPLLLLPSPSRAPFTNSDGAYLVACANNRNAYVGSNELVAVIRDYLPKTPYSKYSPRYTGDIVVRRGGRLGDRIVCTDGTMRALVSLQSPPLCSVVVTNQ